MRWDADEMWLYGWCNDYTNIEYQAVIEEKAWLMEIKTKLLQWY